MKKILVVDDHPMMRDKLRELVEDEGYVVVTAAHGIEALSILKAQDFDLVMTDYQMPGMSGVELIAAITTRYPAVKTMLLSTEPERAKLALNDPNAIVVGKNALEPIQEGIKSLLGG